MLGHRKNELMAGRPTCRTPALPEEMSSRVASFTLAKQSVIDQTSMLKIML